MVAEARTSYRLVGALEALARLSLDGTISSEETASAKARLLAARPVADVRPVGPGRRGRTLAVSLAALRGARGELRAGAAAWLEDLTERYHVAVVTSAEARDGVDVVLRAWLRAGGLSEHALGRVRFPAHKPPADVYVDPAALRFEGEFPDLRALGAIMIRRQ